MFRGYDSGQVLREDIIERVKYLRDEITALYLIPRKERSPAMSYLFPALLALILILGANAVSGDELAEPGKWKVEKALTTPGFREIKPVITQSGTVHRYRVCSSKVSERIVQVISDRVSQDLLAGTCVDVEGRNITISTEGRGNTSGTYQNLD